MILQVDNDTWLDVPREEWVPCASERLFGLLPDDLQRFYQQRNARTGDIRLIITSIRQIETEALAVKIDRLSAALEKLERKL